MSTVTSAVTTCPELQTTLEENFLICPNINVDPITLLPYLYSPENRTGIDMKVSVMPGKTRDLLAVYSQLIPDSQVTTVSDCDGNCTATTERGDLSHIYSMDCDGFLVEELFDPAAWRQSCTSNYSKVSQTILKLIAAMDNKVSKSVVSEVSGLIGAWATEVPVTGHTLVVKTQLDSSVTPNPSAWQDIDLAMLQTGYCAPAFLAGGAALYKYMRLLEAGCCATSGLNLAEMMSLYGKAVTWDAHIQATLGQYITWSIQQGAIQLLTLNMNGGSEGEIGYINVGPNANTEFAGIVNSPFTGLPYDLTVRYDCKKIHIILEARVKAVGLPLDMFPAGHRLAGVTYTNVIQVANV
jgi:hypothetical protein